MAAPDVHSRFLGTVSPNLANQATLGIALVLAVAGMIDAGVGRHWDLVVILGLVDALIATVLAGTRVGRPAVPLRGDLVQWLRHRAVTTGEPLGAIADRAVSGYRDRIDVVADGRPSA